MQGFPDVEDALCEILEPLGGTGTATDEDLNDIPIRVNRTGTAGRPRAWEDSAIVEVTAFCATRPESQALNRKIVAALLDRRQIQTTAGFIDKITGFNLPVPLPDLNPDARKVTSTWTVTSRLQDIPDPDSD